MALNHETVRVSSSTRSYGFKHILVVPTDFTVSVGINQYILVYIVVYQYKVTSGPPELKSWKLELPQSIRVWEVGKFWQEFSCTTLHTLNSSYFCLSNRTPYGTTVLQVWADQRFYQQFKHFFVQEFEIILYQVDHRVGFSNFLAYVELKIQLIINSHAKIFFTGDFLKGMKGVGVASGSSCFPHIRDLW